MNSFIKSLYKNHSSQIIWTAAFSQRSVDILRSASWLPSAVPFCTGKSWGSPCSQSLVCVCFLLRIQWWGVLRTRSWIHGNLFNYTASQCTRNSFKSAHCPLLFLINLMNHLNFRHFIIYHGPTKKGVGMGKGDEYSSENSTKERLSGKLGSSGGEGWKTEKRDGLWSPASHNSPANSATIRSLVPSDSEENVNSSWLPGYPSCLASKLQQATSNIQPGITGLGQQTAGCP